MSIAVGVEPDLLQLAHRGRDLAVAVVELPRGPGFVKNTCQIPGNVRRTLRSAVAMRRAQLIRHSMWRQEDDEGEEDEEEDGGEHSRSTTARAHAHAPRTRAAWHCDTQHTHTRMRDSTPAHTWAAIPLSILTRSSPPAPPAAGKQQR